MRWLRRWRYRRWFNKWWDESVAEFLRELEDYDPMSDPPVKLRTHAAGTCLGEFCTIHNPSDHHMKAWPQTWRGDRRLMERICPHGVGHPDPDDLNPDTVHGCDGCCSNL